jgi:hypothetical protein
MTGARLAILAGMHQEWVETLREVDAVKTHGIDSVLASVRDLMKTKVEVRVGVHK